MPKQTMMETEDASPKVTETENEIESEASEEIQRKVKLEATLTSGCGYGRKKQRLLDTFWSTVWSGLKKSGWRKVVGSGKNEGSITFFPAGIDETTAKRGKDYYDRIKDVIDRVLEERNEDEIKIAEAFLAEEKTYEPKQAKGNSALVRPRRRAAAIAAKNAAAKRTSGRPSLSGGLIDLSWKDGGTTYPKQSSRLGSEYQATDIPALRSAKDVADSSSDSSEYCQLIWDPKIGEEKGAASFVEDKVPYNKKEEALAALHENGYSLTNVNVITSRINPIDGSDWTGLEKDLFITEIFRLRKDMRALSKAMNKDMKSCLAYYLGTYKKSDHYRLLKTVCVDERNEKVSSSVHGIDACAVCGDGGSLLICDGCEGEYHMSCLRPPLKTIPEGHWECDECVDRKFVEAREYILRHAVLYEPFQGNGKKRKAEHQQDGSMSETDVDADEDIMLRLSSPVLKAVQTLAGKINKAFSASSSWGVDDVEVVETRVATTALT